MLTVTLYTRKDCSLCDEVKADLQSLEKQLPHRLVEVDIDSDPSLQKAFGEQIPVVEIGPYSLKAPITKQQLHMTLGAALDRRGQLEKVGDERYQSRVKRGQSFTPADRISFWLSRHYLLLLNALVLFYVGLPFLAPVFMKVGAPVPARVIYAVYSPLCHQFGFRSFFLFGEQAFYPLAEANVPGAITFEEATGLADLQNPNSLSRLDARNFTGNEAMGYKVALCERDVAIYGGMLLFGLIFGLTRRRLPPLHWALWLVLGLGPIGLDGFSQLFSQFNWEFLSSLLPYRESTPFLRVFTGGIFGLCTAWFAYPNIEESMQETRQFFAKKLAVLKTS
ncbi:MAG: glutaredoxin family protein [Chloroflexota bacterium]